jgi:hypothetical protein
MLIALHSSVWSTSYVCVFACSRCQHISLLCRDVAVLFICVCCWTLTQACQDPCPACVAQQLPLTHQGMPRTRLAAVQVGEVLLVELKVHLTHVATARVPPCGSMSH